MKASDRAVRSLVNRTDGTCGTKWKAGRLLNDGQVSLEFRYGKNSDDLDSIDVFADSGRLSPVSTPEGAHIGTTVSELQKLYGKVLHSSSFDGGESGVYKAQVLFGADGAIVFMVGDPNKTGTLVVYDMSAVAGTNMRNLNAPGFGC